MNVLEVKHLSFSYDGRRNVFEDIDLTLQPGQVRCIVGPNGCGKTTLIDCVLGLHRPAAGEILVAADRPKAGSSPDEKAASGACLQDIRQMKEAQRAACLAYVPQGHRTTFGFTVLDVVAMGRTYAQKMFSPPGEAEYAAARQSLAKVGLAGYEDRDYTRLSGGELQLVIIARAITQKARVLVMDEPTAHLDFRHEMQVMEITAKLAKEQGLSILMATHFLNQAYYLENAGVDTRVSLMCDGHFDGEGWPSSVLTEEALRRAFGIETEIVESRGRKFILSLGTGEVR